MPIEISKEKNLAADALFSVTALRQLTINWVKDQAILADTICLALMLHVLLFPVLWVAGWALPWPKSPVVTTVIEINLENWPREAKSKKLYEFRDPELNK